MDSSTARDQSFWQFSDQLRLHTASLSNLSLGDSIWSDRANPDDRRNVDVPSSDWRPSFAPLNQKLAFGYTNPDRFTTNVNANEGTGSGLKGGGGYFNNNGSSNYNNGQVKNYFNKAVGKPVSGGGGSNRKNSNSNDGHGSGKKKNVSNNNNNNNGNGNGGSGAVDKRFKTLPPSEALPRSEAVGGYIFVCNNDTMQENLKRQLFGLPPRYRDSVRAITPGLPLFLYNYSTHQLHGIFEAASFGGTNIDPTAWEDKKSHGESRFPAQVKVMTRKICEPLEEDSFRPILHHYDGPKFRLELSVPEALALLDIFAENNA